nr:reverse transcriptase domain-containing protein [Tanacetum cinerariifolium]
RPKIKKQLIPATTPLIGFSGEIIWPIGQIQLLVKIKDEEHSALVWMNFMIVMSQSPYNGIIGRQGVRKLQAGSSTAHEMLKISIEGGVITLKSSKLVPLERAMVSGPAETLSATKPIAEERVKRSLDIFAWKLVDMTGVPRHIAEHRLNVRDGCSPIRQKKRGQATNRNQAIQEEVEKLVVARIMRETTKAEEAFKQMKQLTAELPMLTAPMEKEDFIVYLAAAKETVSAVLMTEREAKQMPIYFVSRALSGLELNYTSMEKLVLALVHASKRLKRPEEGSPDTLTEEEVELLEPWILFTDGPSCTDGSRAGLILTNPEEMEFTYALRFRFDATNNEAEYEALIARLRIAEQMGVKNLQANVDSRLVANQVNETYVAKDVDMIRYLEKVKALEGSFKAFSIKQTPRSENKKSDALSKLASTSFAHLSKQVMVKELKEKSISELEILAVVEKEGNTWMTPLFKYLAEGTLPADVKKAREIKQKFGGSS